MLSRHRPTHTTVVAYLALFVALGGSSYAALKVTGRNVKNGSLTGADIKKRSVQLNRLKGTLPAGQPGPKGDQGLNGDPGPKGDKGDKGDTGTVDTSNFYDKATSDGRFLGIAAQATDSAALGGVAATDYMRDLGATGGQIKGTGSTTILGAPGFGEVKGSCADPAQPTISWHNTTAGNERLIVDDGSADAVHVDSLAADGTAGTVAGSTSGTVGDHVTYLVRGDRTTLVEVFDAVNGDFCFFFARQLGT